MGTSGIDQIFALLNQMNREAPRARAGKITAVAAGTLSVNVGGTVLTHAPYLASYLNPAVNDQVLVIQTSDQVVILGRIRNS
jgi:hypothetical protein